MQLDIITPEKILFSADVTMAVIPGREGDFGVLEGHAPFVSTVRPGIVSIDTTSSEKRKIAIVGGIAEVNPERCTVLAEAAVDCTGLTAADIQARIAAARDAVDLAPTDTQKRDAARKLALAEAMAPAA